MKDQKSDIVACENQKEITIDSGEFNLQKAIFDVMQRNDLNPDRLEKFMDLQFKMEDRQKEQEFNESLSAFQLECPIIKKTKHVQSKSVDYWYAPLDEMVYQIKPLLNKHGLSFTFNMFEMQGSDHAELVTTIHHKNGYKKSTKYHFDPIHDDQKMNLSQRRKSALTFAKREGLQSALGIVVTGQDDDARRAVDEMASQDQVLLINELVEKTGADKKGLEKYLQVESLDNLSKKDAEIAIKALRTKKYNKINNTTLDQVEKDNV